MELNKNIVDEIIIHDDTIKGNIISSIKNYKKKDDTVYLAYSLNNESKRLTNFIKNTGFKVDSQHEILSLHILAFLDENFKKENIVRQEKFTSIGYFYIENMNINFKYYNLNDKSKMLHFKNIKDTYCVIPDYFFHQEKLNAKESPLIINLYLSDEHRKNRVPFLIKNAFKSKDSITLLAEEYFRNKQKLIENDRNNLED